MALFIGDVHGKYERYKKIIKRHKDTIQIGDMGVGFFRPHDLGMQSNPPYDAMVEGGHRFIRGNHDNPHVCARHTQCIADGTVEGDTMFIGGAMSIDRAYRTEGLSWWPEEELSYQRWLEMQDIYEKTKPRIMVTHDCPECVVSQMPVHYHKEFPSRTRQALQNLFEIHRPEFWVFGHWHISSSLTLLGTQFTCLNELEILDIG